MQRIDGRLVFSPSDLNHFLECEPVAEAEHHDQVTRESPKIGRNEAWPCGSGRKYKNCCGAM